MDIHVIGAEPTADERAAVDRFLGPPDTGWVGADRDVERDGRTAAGGRAVMGRRDLLLPVLHAVQDQVGWVSHGALNYICLRLTVPPAEAWGVVTFYHLLSTEPRPAAVAHICDDIACRLNGAEQMCQELGARLGAAGGAWQRSPCLGQCDLGSAALVTRAGSAPERFVISPVASADQVIEALRSGARAREDSYPATYAYPGPKLLGRVNVANPESLASYRAHGGYAALHRAVELGPARVIAEVTASKLLGRGGAAFPTGRKWDSVAREAARPHYVVCNADESEPGTFKDRVLMEADPFAVIEAMTICGLATGGERGFIYIRGEYPLAEQRIAGAIEQATAAGLLGADVAGSGAAFTIEIRRGGGAYICGEETALFNSIEGKRGEPRSKPPFPAQFGLFGKPTVVNNVETLVNVLDILLEGGEAWARTGTAASTGTRLFCLAGHVARPGLYEVPFGETLAGVIALAGGVTGGRPLQAVLLGGAAGVFVGPEALSMPLTFEGVRAAGATLGSGVVMVFDDTTDLVDTLSRIAEFFHHESCGQCVPCRVGTVRQEELLQALRASVTSASSAAPFDSAHPGDASLRAGRHVNSAQSASSAALVASVLGELGQAMRDASICGLGQTASSAIESAIANLHLFDQRGPS